MEYYKKSKAQSIVEYLLVFGAIVLAVIYGANKLGTSTKGQMDNSAKLAKKGSTALTSTMGVSTVDTFVDTSAKSISVPDPAISSSEDQ